MPDVIVDDSSDSSQSNARVKTWFSSVQSDDGKSSSAPDIFLPTDQDGIDDEDRGRTLDSDEESSRPGSRSRRTSTHSTRSTRSTKSASAQSQVPEGNALRRSLSKHFNFEKGESSSSDALHTRRNSSSTPKRMSTDGSQTNRSPSPASFFSTLKSKAGDKQALTNTAKETMRKWGMNVNWGLKKDNASGGEDSSDAASSSSRLPAGQDSTQGHAHRGSYAEVRAAVAERKEREKTSEQGGSRPTSPFLSTEAPGPSNTASSPASSLTPVPSHSGDSATNPSIIAAAARLSTPGISSKKSMPSMSRVNTDIDAEPAGPPDTPIKAQPQAKVMAIPGIHARHRGEIQALGHVAETPPAPTAPAPSKTLTTLESKLKNPAIQTVYRFWRSPSISVPGSGQNGEASSSQGQAAPAMDAGPSSSPDSSSTTSARGGDDSSTSQPAVRPIPPPLPPRPSSASVASSSSASTSPSASIDSVAITSTTPPSSSSTPSHTPSSSTSSPARAALQSIASKDEGFRNALLSSSQSHDHTDSQQTETPSGSANGAHAQASSATRQQEDEERTPPLPAAEGALNAPRCDADEGINKVSSAEKSEPINRAVPPRPPLPPRPSSSTVPVPAN